MRYGVTKKSGKTIWLSQFLSYIIQSSNYLNSIQEYYEFSKNDVLLMHQFKVLVASSIKTVAWSILHFDLGFSLITFSDGVI